MRGLIIKQQVYEGAIAFVHNMSFTVHRLLVPEANNLCATVHNEQLYVVSGFADEKYEIVGEVDVPSELVIELQQFAETRERLRERVACLMQP